MRKFFSLVLVAVALLVSTNMWAQNVARIGTTEYADLATALNACQTGETVELMKNITLTGNWTPIEGFKGTLNGKYKTISGLTVSGAGYVGLFKSLDGNTVKNLTISGANITSTGNYAGVLAGEVASGSIINVTIDDCTITSSGEYVGGLFGAGYSNVKTCIVEDCNISGSEQVGGFIGYMWVGSILNSTATGNAISAASRAGGLIGKVQFAGKNIGTDPAARMKINENEISGTVTATDGVKGGLAGQIMGDDARYEIQKNTIDVANIAYPIGTLRDGQNATFTGALESNIQLTKWTDATLNADSYQYTNVAAGVSAQTIYRGVAKIGDNVYITLQEAFDAVQDGETIKLISDVVLNGNMNLTLTGKTVTLDLNDKTWKLNNSTEAQVQGMRVYAGNIIVKNGSIIYDAPASSCTFFDMYAGTKLTIEDVTMSSTNTGTAIKSNGEVVINGGEMAYISLGDKATALTINDGTISSQISLPSNPETTVEVEINGGTIENLTTMNDQIRGTRVTVNGGEITWLQNTDSTFINGGKIDNINGGFNVIMNGDIEAMYYEKNPDEAPYYKQGTFDIRGGVFTNYKYICDEGEREIEQDFPANLKRVENMDPDTKDEYPYTLGANDDFFTREVKKGNWGTVCYEKNITRATDAKLYQFVARNTAKTKVMVEEVKAEDIEINKPYLFNALAAIQMFAYGATAVTSLEENNGLIGKLVDYKTTEAAWVVKESSIIPAAVGSDVPKFRAYVNVDEIDEDDSVFEEQVSAPKRGRLIFNLSNNTTELENVNANVNANGKVMIDGKLVIVKDGKMFNAMGVEL